MPRLLRRDDRSNLKIIMVGHWEAVELRRKQVRSNEFIPFLRFQALSLSSFQAFVIKPETNEQ